MDESLINSKEYMPADTVHKNLLREENLSGLVGIEHFVEKTFIESYNNYKNGCCKAKISWI